MSFTKHYALSISRPTRNFFVYKAINRESIAC